MEFEKLGIRMEQPLDKKICYLLDPARNLGLLYKNRQISSKEIVGLWIKAWIKPNHVAPEPICSGSTFSLLTYLSSINNVQSWLGFSLKLTSTVKV
jgi:hypothetical protein